MYIDMPSVGLGGFAALEPARGSLFSARRRLGLRDETDVDSAVTEEQLYDS